MVKAITIIEDDMITGVKYGLVTIPEHKETITPTNAKQAYKNVKDKIAKYRAQKMKQTRIRRK